MKSLPRYLYNQIRKVLSRNHDGLRVIQHTDLSYRNINFNRFENVTFVNVTFYESNLRGIDFRNCTFDSCSFRHANLRITKFKNCTFTRSDFDCASLRSGQLFDSQFRSCRFEGANFDNANIHNVNFLNCYSICPTRMLLAHWGILSHSLTKELMRYDAENHPDKERFRQWVKEDSCPYQDCAIGRVALFSENSTIYQHAKKNTRALPAYELMLRCFKEHNIKLEGNLH